MVVQKLLCIWSLSNLMNVVQPSIRHQIFIIVMLSSSLTTRHGFHTTYSTHIIANDPADLARCTCHLLHILPPRVFVDPYELANYRDFYTIKLSGNLNLELPVTAVDSKGSALLLNVLLPMTGMQNVTVDVPLHLRYGEPVQLDAWDDGSVKVPLPTGFWVCPSSCTSYPCYFGLLCLTTELKHLNLHVRSQACQ